MIGKLKLLFYLNTATGNHTPSSRPLKLFPYSLHFEPRDRTPE